MSHYGANPRVFLRAKRRGYRPLPKARSLQVFEHPLAKSYRPISKGAFSTRQRPLEAGTVEAPGDNVSHK